LCTGDGIPQLRCRAIICGTCPACPCSCTQNGPHAGGDPALTPLPERWPAPGWAGLRMLSLHLSFGLPTLPGLSSLPNTHCHLPYSTFLRSQSLRAKSYSLSVFSGDLARIRSTRQHGSSIDSRRRKRKRGNFRIARARFSKTETLPKWASSIRLQGSYIGTPAGLYERSRHSSD
jgi:hypothetical protein